MEIYKERKGEIEFYPQNLLKMLLNKVWLIIPAMIIGGAIFLTFTVYGIQKQYTTYTTLYVNNSSVSEAPAVITSNDLSVAQSLVDAYAVIITSKTAIQQVITASGVDISNDKLMDMINVEAQSGTSLFKVYVTDNDPIEAALIANTIANVAKDQIASVIEGSSVKIIDAAEIPENSSSPNYKVNTLIGILVGMIISVSYVFLKAASDRRVYTANDLENWDYPVIGVIPDLKVTTSKKKKKSK